MYTSTTESPSRTRSRAHVLAFLPAVVLAAAVAQAQNTTPPTGAGDPTGASSPHQRSTTGAKTPEAATTGSPEASSASSPHQQSAAAQGVSESKLKMARQDGAVPETFVKKAALDGMTEVELAKVALQQSKDEKVRAFAERMVADHGKANKELASVAKSKQIDVPMALDAEHQAMVQSLSGKSGAAFDAAYSEHMRADHAKAVALFEGASKGTDTELATFAKKTLPTLQEHKKMADALAVMHMTDASEDSSTKK
jgi:putative membrane protein